MPALYGAFRINETGFIHIVSSIVISIQAIAAAFTNRTSKNPASAAVTAAEGMRHIISHRES
jgi:hypothetical protein